MLAIQKEDTAFAYPTIPFENCVCVTHVVDDLLLVALLEPCQQA